MKEEKKHMDKSRRIRLEDIPRPGNPDVPEAYFEGLEECLMGIPGQRAGRVRKIGQWYWISSAAAAVVMLVLFFTGLFNNANDIIGTDEAYAYLTESTMSYDPALDIALTEAMYEEGFLEGGEDLDSWEESDAFLESTSDEAILDYLGDYADLNDIAEEY